MAEDRNKELKKQRMYTYFIDAALSIIEENDINNVTIRAVADRAGYNSATLYNYFDNLDHLKYFAVLSYLNNYTESIDYHIQKTDTYLDRYKKIWLTFSTYAFQYSIHFQLLFFSELSHNSNEYIKQYYTYFPDLIEEKEPSLVAMLLEEKLVNRSRVLVEEAIKHDEISQEKGYKIDEMVLLIFQSLLENVKNEQLEPVEAYKDFEKYLDFLI